MEPRLDLLGSTVTTKFAKYLASASKVVTDSALPAATQELVKLRASQINGCAVCTDMHAKDAAARRGDPAAAATWSRCGGRRRSSPRPSGPPWS